MARPDAVTWKRLAGWSAGALVAMGLFLAALNATALPMRIASRFVEMIEARTGLEIDVSGARLAGPGHLRLEGVTFASAEGALSHGEVAEVHLRFDPVRVLRALWSAPSEGSLGTVDLVRPRLSLREELVNPGSSAAPKARSRGPAGPAAGGGSDRAAWNAYVRVIDGVVEEAGRTGRAWRVDGRFVLGPDPELVKIERVNLRDGRSGLELELSSEEGLVHWRARGPAQSLLEAVRALPWAIEGEALAEGTATLSGELQEVALAVEGGSVAWGSGPSETAAFERLELEMARGSEAWDVRSLALTRGAAVVRAEGAVQLPGQGEAGRVDLRVSSEGLDLPEGIAPLEALGFRGRARFAGTLSGSFDRLQLAGRLSMEKGSVWHRPVDRAEGTIRLGPGFFRFEDAELVRGTAHYRLRGEIAHAASPIEFRVELSAVGGQVEEVLAAAGLEAEATGRFDGTLQFARQGADLVIEGDVARAAGELMGQPFDAVQGSFRWSGDGLWLPGARAAWGGGLLELAGEAREGALDFEVRLSRWPLEMNERFPLKPPAGLAGWVSYSGTLTGTLDAPVLAGELTGGSVALGSLRLAGPRGRLEISADEARFSGVEVNGAGGGLYRLSGTVGGWREEAPRLNLGIEVAGASLSSLLREGGLNVPALLFDGDVSGKIAISGTSERPAASFDLTLSDGLGVGEPLRLRFEVVDGQVRLGRTALASLAGGAPTP